MMSERTSFESGRREEPSLELSGRPEESPQDWREQECSMIHHKLSLLSDPEIGEVLERLETKYKKWHRKSMGRIYEVTRDHPFDESSKGRKTFIRDTGKGTMSKLPGEDFFTKWMLGTVLSLSNTAAEVEQIGIDAIRTLDILISGVVRWNEFSRINQTQIYNFFADVREDEFDLRFDNTLRKDADIGQFKYFYSRFGSDIANLVAFYQSEQPGVFASSYSIHQLMTCPLGGYSGSESRTARPSCSSIC